MLIDTHAHLNFSAYKTDAPEVIRRSLDNNIWMINVGSQYTTSKRAVEIAGRYKEGVYAAVGLHPIYAKEKFDYDKFKNLAKSPKMVAIGEVGLDYKSEYSSFGEEQRAVLGQQLKLAGALDLPVIFHCRMAHPDLIQTLQQSDIPKLRGVIHCFTGSLDEAKKYLDMGFFLGFNGIIFKLNLEEVIEKVPLEKILIETDCPYLTPPPEDGRNEPLYVRHVAEKIARIKNMSYEEIANITTQNAQKLFKI